MTSTGYPRRGLHGEVVHAIGLRILRGELEPGDLLPPEEQLSREFFVSRSVTREAIKVLTAKGLVQSKPRTGTWVRPRRYWNLLDPDVFAWRLEAGPDNAFLDEITCVRRLIEPATARLAAEWATQDEVSTIEQGFRELQDSIDDPDAYVAADVRFHTAVFRACHNELLEHLGEMLRGAYWTSFTVLRRMSGPTPELMEHHEAVLRAIAAHDGDAAEQAMLELIDGTAAIREEREEAVEQRPVRPRRASSA